MYFGRRGGIYFRHSVALEVGAYFTFFSELNAIVFVVLRSAEGWIMKLFISPHSDDETLFGAFTIQRERPLVVVVFDSFTQVNRGADYCDALTRRKENANALISLGQFSHYQCNRDGIPDKRMIDSAQQADWRDEWVGRKDVSLKFCGLRDDMQYSDHAIAVAIFDVCPDGITHIYAPAQETSGHGQHSQTARAAQLLAGQVVPESTLAPIPITYYTTYTRTGGKTRTANPVPIEQPEWIERKLRALACYKSQIRLENCREHFTRDLLEYTL